MSKNPLILQGRRPEDLTREEREQAIMSSPAFQKHIKAMEDHSDDKSSGSYKSKLRLNKSAAEFYSECLTRGTVFTSQERVYSDPEALKAECIAFVSFCIEHDYVMSWTSLGLWLGVTRETLLMAKDNPDLDPRFATLKRVGEIIENIMENELMNNEGSAVGKIYLTKARFGWGEGPLEVNVTTSSGDGPRFPEPEDVIDMIEATPISEDE